jgi:predicted glycoside hydrolase/deacetylase ChbG (UPF0249 family)
MRRLIVNADDLGINAPRSHGIFLSFEHGIVRSATLIVNGSDAETAARRAREKNLPTGLHLNLTQGEPISAPTDVSSLLEANGNFFDRHALSRALGEGTVEPLHIEREIRAQVEWFLDHHGAPTHLDGHHSIHTHPVIVPLLIPVMHRYGIRLVRMHDEPLPPFGWEISEQRLAHLQTLCEQARAARALFEANGITSTDHFRGLALSGNASQKNLRHILSKLPEGTTELMTHPGSPTPLGDPFDLDPQRQTELAMLTDERLPAYLKERGVELCSYQDL